MNKLLVALIAGVFAAAVGAQTPAPAAESTAKKLTTNPKAAEVGSVTKEASNVNTGATDAKEQAANVAKSKKDPKALTTTKEKQSTVGAVTAAQSDPNSTQATAAQQKANVAKSKTEPKVEKPKLGTPENEALMQKRSTP
jgi:hypothetical protein